VNIVYNGLNLDGIVNIFPVWEVSGLEQLQYS